MILASYVSNNWDTQPVSRQTPPVFKKYPAYLASTPPVLIKTLPRLPGIFEKDTPPRRANKIMRFIC